MKICLQVIVKTILCMFEIRICGITFAEPIPELVNHSIQCEMLVVLGLKLHTGLLKGVLFYLQP